MVKANGGGLIHGHRPESRGKRRTGHTPKAGHFAALDQPELLAREMREFFRPLR